MHHYHVAPYAPRYWATGVFIYQPPPPPPRVAGAPRRAAKVAEPARDVDHSNSLSIGLQTGSYLSGYANGASYGDLGFGVNARYRGNEALGVEVSYGYFSDSFTSSTERVTQPLSASVDLFAFPWTKVSPYLSGGVTWTARSYDDTIAMASPNQPAQTFQTRDLQFGPHIGLGLELSLGKKSSIDLEGRYTHFVTHEDGLDVSSPDNLQGIVGLNMYF
jgi:opacity protein-like surface antigen